MCRNVFLFLKTTQKAVIGRVFEFKLTKIRCEYNKHAYSKKVLFRENHLHLIKKQDRFQLLRQRFFLVEAKRRFLWRIDFIGNCILVLSIAITLGILCIQRVLLLN